MKRVVLVNGVPASGKSHVARIIATRFAMPLASLDGIKEAFFDHLGTGDREYNRKLGRASYQAIWSMVEASPPEVVFVIDAWFGFQPRDVLEGYLARAGVIRPIEIWCHAPPAVLAERYRARSGKRHAGHPGESYVPELVALAGRAAPMAVGPVRDIDTSRAFDREALLSWLATELTHV